MDTRRLGIALFVALVISIVITSFFYLRFSKQQANSKPKTRKVVAAAVALQPGSAIPPESVTEIDWPENLPIEGAISSKEDAVGRVLVYPITANEPIRTRDLAGSGASIGLTAKIPVGMRAAAVRTNEVNNIAGFLLPGSHVDVLLTMRAANSNEPVTRTVLQNVQVLSAGTKIEPDPQGKPENVSVVTLLVTPEESQKLVLAQNQGSIQFVLRNGGDSALINTPMEDVAMLAGGSSAPAATTHVAAKTERRATVSKPAVYTVETLAGGKTTVAEFRPKSQ
jgi:pilus assembly protein CpaB